MKKRYDILTFHPRRHHNFEQAARLERYFKRFKHVTGLYFSPFLVKLVSKFSKKAAQTLSKRSYRFNRKSIISTYKIPEITRFIKKRKKQPVDYTLLDEKFGKWLVKHFAPPKICLGFDTSSRYVFERWKGQSFLILDLVIGIPQYRVKMNIGEEVFKPEDLKTCPEKDQKLFQLYKEELELADLILCGSEFVKKTCIEFNIPRKKLKVIPYGVDIERFKNENKKFNTTTENLKFIFIGAVGYRKGADYLVKAWTRFIDYYPNGHELHFYGKVEIDIDKNIQGVYLHGQVNQNDLIEEMKTADVFVFPTTFEGSSYSIFQAMAMQLAVITTENSGTVLKNEESALIIPYSDSLATFKALERLTYNPQLRVALAQKAYQEAWKYTWDNYGIRLKSLLERLLLTID